MPVGALKKIPLNEVRKNEAFTGLDASAAQLIDSYVHFRAPLHEKNVELNKRREGVYNDAFLDNASEDHPKQCWSVMHDTTGKTVIMRNKLWPGFTAYHQYSTTSFGGMYIGNGVKALDIAFMF